MLCVQDEEDDEESALDAKRRRRWGEQSPWPLQVYLHANLAELRLVCRARSIAPGPHCGACKPQAERVPAGPYFANEQITSCDPQHTLESAGESAARQVTNPTCSLSASCFTCRVLGLQAGYYCSVCDCILRDSQSYLDHINGKWHNRALGMSMRVERSNAEQVNSFSPGEGSS